MPASPPADHDQPSDSNVSLAVTRVTTPGGRGSIITSTVDSSRALDIGVTQMSRSETSWLLGSFSVPEAMPEPDKTFSPCWPVSS